MSTRTLVRVAAVRERRTGFRARMISVAVIDPDPVIRRGLAAFVTAAEDLTVTTEAAELPMPHDAPDAVVVVGISPEDRTALELIRRRRGRGRLAAVVLVTSRLSDALVREAFEAGADGLLLRTSVADELVAAIREVARGGTWVDSEVTAVLTALATKGRPNSTDERGLTVQERRVLRLLPGGLTNRQIAAELGVSVDTVKTHLRNALAKLGAHDRIEAARIVQRDQIR